MSFRAPLPAVPDTFPHDRHRKFACITCHSTRQGHGGLTFVAPRGCQLCHHDTPATNDCARCHAAEERPAPRALTVRVAVAGHAPRDRSVMFRHATHETQRCVTCHTTAVTLAADPVVVCKDCHEPHHNLGRDCGTCHASADPKTAHATLADMHVACDNCHAEAVVSLLTPNRSFCATCHADKREHYSERECTVCHFLSAPDEFRAHLRRSEGGA